MYSITINLTLPAWRNSNDIPVGSLASDDSLDDLIAEALDEEAAEAAMQQLIIERDASSSLGAPQLSASERRCYDEITKRGYDVSTGSY